MSPYSDFTCKFRITRGSTKDFKVIFQSGDDISNAESIVMTIKENVTTPDSEITLQKDYDETKSALNQGVMVFSFLPEDTRDLDDGTYLFDIQITVDSEHIYVPCVGEFTVHRNIFFRTQF